MNWTSTGSSFDLGPARAWNARRDRLLVTRHIIAKKHDCVTYAETAATDLAKVVDQWSALPLCNLLICCGSALLPHRCSSCHVRVEGVADHRSRAVALGILAVPYSMTSPCARERQRHVAFMIILGSQLGLMLSLSRASIMIETWWECLSTSMH